jgi:trans-aconitate methyltransferase
MIDQLALGLLQRCYGFDHWHTQAPLSARPYRKTIAQVVNALQPECVVEVGCGLGVILSLVKARHRHGYDLDAAAISAARLIRSRSILFSQGDLSSVSEARLDVLILVNWIHDISPDKLSEWLYPLLPRTRYLLLDAIDPDNSSGYRWTHDFSFLRGKANLISKIRSTGEGRSFQLFEVID